MYPWPLSVVRINYGFKFGFRLDGTHRHKLELYICLLSSGYNNRGCFGSLESNPTITLLCISMFHMLRILGILKIAFQPRDCITHAQSQDCVICIRNLQTLNFACTTGSE